MLRMALHNWVLTTVGLVCLATPVWSQDASSTRIVSEKLVATIKYDSVERDNNFWQDFRVSYDLRHVGYVVAKDKKLFVIVDGKEGPAVDRVDNGSSHTDEKYYRVYDDLDNRSRITFSRDGERYAYKALVGNKWMAVVDGQPGESFDSLAGPIFSADSKRVAFVARSGTRMFLVVDGKKGEKGWEYISRFTFNPKTQQIAYYAVADNKSVVVLEGKEYEGLGFGPYFSPDGARVAYIAHTDEKDYLVVDGKAGKIYDSITNFAFSPDGKHFFYIASTGRKGSIYASGIIPGRSPRRYFKYDKDVLVVDGNEVGSQDLIHNYYMSSDGNHVAYLVVEGGFFGKGFVVVDGKPERKERLIQAVIFSPDGKHAAYRTAGGIIAGGSKVGDGWPTGGLPVFSPNSERLAFVEGDDNYSYVFVDGKKIKTYRAAYDMVFSPDSKRVAYVARSGKKCFVVVDGIEGTSYNHIPNGPVFDSPDSFHYFAFKADGLYLIEERLK